METFAQFYEAEILDEAGLKDAFLAKVKELSTNAVGKAKKLLAGLDFERKETIFMLETFFTQLKELLKKEKTITDEAVKRALKQLGDVGKFTLIAPLFLMPGGGTTTAVLYMTAKKLFNISILPQGLEQVFEVVLDIEQSLKQINEQETQTMKEFDAYLNEQLGESSLSRIWQHIQNHQAGAISGYRDENSKEENKQNNREIKAYLRRKGYSVTGVQGSYIENFNSENAREVGEPSFFVVDIEDKGTLIKDLSALGRRFDQDSVLLIPKGGKGKGAYLFGTSKRDDTFPTYGQTIVVGDSKFGKAAGEFLSRIGGRAFAFEEVKYPGTINGKRGWAILAEQVEKEMKQSGQYHD